MPISLGDAKLEELRASITQIISIVINPQDEKTLEFQIVEKILALIKEKVAGPKILESAGHSFSDEIDTHIMELLNISFIEYNENAQIKQNIVSLI